MPNMNILVGNIGSGKSTIARKLANQGDVVVNMDNIQESIAGGLYGAYDREKKDIYHAVESTIIESALKSNYPVCVDRTNMDKKRRASFIEIGKKYTNNIKCFDFGPGSEDDLQRRLNNSKGTPGETWKKVFDFMKASYEKPELSEGFSEIIIPPGQYKFHAFDFDGLIVKNKFPKIGDIISGTVDRMNEIYKDLENIIIIWSCRSGDYESSMRDFLLKNKIPFDFINENPIFNTGSRKIFAH